MRDFFGGWTVLASTRRRGTDKMKDCNVYYVSESRSEP